MEGLFDLPHISDDCTLQNKEEGNVQDDANYGNGDESGKANKRPSSRDGDIHNDGDEERGGRNGNGIIGKSGYGAASGSGRAKCRG